MNKLILEKSLEEIYGEISAQGVAIPSQGNGSSFNFSMPDPQYSQASQDALAMINKYSNKAEEKTPEPSYQNLKRMAQDLILNIDTVNSNRTDPLTDEEKETLEDMCSALDEIINDIIQMRNNSNVYYGNQNQSYDGEVVTKQGMITIPLGTL